MKIVRFQAENIKKLRVVEISPRGDVIQITGRNGQGKTSVLDSIFWGLGGADDIQAKAIRQGENSARITLDLGEIVVTRKFRKADTGEEKTDLIVESANGARFPSPQRMLDDLIGSISFDPLAFSRMKPKEQADMLRRLVPLAVDIDALNGLNLKDFDSRTDINRQAKAKRAQADGITVPADLPAQKIDTADLLHQMETAAETNTDIETRKVRREQAAEKIAGLRQTAANDAAKAVQLRAEADTLDKQSAVFTKDADDLQAKLDGAEALPEPVDTAALSRQIADAQAKNALIDKRIQREALVKEADALEAEAENLTDSIDARKAEIAKAIAAAAMPVAGLGFGEGVVTFNGLPLDQASSAEQLRISTAIAMAGNPKLKVIRIKDGSLLDDVSMALLAEMASANGFQCWVESVDTTGKVGIVMEDGAVVADNLPGDALPPAERPTDQPAATKATRQPRSRPQMPPSGDDGERLV